MFQGGIRRGDSDVVGNRYVNIDDDTGVTFKDAKNLFGTATTKCFPFKNIQFDDAVTSGERFKSQVIAKLDMLQKLNSTGQHLLW